MAALPEQIEEQIASIVAENGLVLIDLVRRGHTNSTVIEVIVDREEGVDIDTIALVNRAISAMLDEDEYQDQIPGRYRLEVSTPGLDRPLEHDWQFRKNIGRLVKVSYEDEAGKNRTDLFRLLDGSAEVLQLEPVSKGKSGKGQQKKGGEPLSVPRGQIRKIVVEPEF